MSYIETVDLIFVVALTLDLFAKVVLFFKFKHETWKAYNLFYFTHYDIVLTRNTKKERISRIQNNLSLVALLMLGMYLFLKIMIFRAV